MDLRWQGHQRRAEAGEIISLYPQDSEIYFANLPQRKINGAYTFHVGFEESIFLFHPESKTRVYDLGQLKEDGLEVLRGGYKGVSIFSKRKVFEKYFNDKGEVSSPSSL